MNPLKLLKELLGKPNRMASSHSPARLKSFCLRARHHRESFPHQGLSWLCLSVFENHRQTEVSWFLEALAFKMQRPRDVAAEGLHAQGKTSGHVYSLCVFHGSGHPGLLDAYPFLWLLSTTLLTNTRREGGKQALSFCPGERGL